MGTRTEKQIESIEDLHAVKKEDASTKASGGARKVALFLSVLEPETADALLTLFSPEIAREIAREAQYVDRVSPKDVDAVISEFLNSVGRETLGKELTNALVDEARRRVSESALDVLESDALATSLLNERYWIRAVVLTTLSSENRERLLDFWNVNDRELTAKYSAVLNTDQVHEVCEGVKCLEDVLFERALNNE